MNCFKNSDVVNKYTEMTKDSSMAYVINKAIKRLFINLVLITQQTEPTSAIHKAPVLRCNRQWRIYNFIKAHHFLKLKFVLHS